MMKTAARRLLNLAILLAALFGVSATLRALLPFPEIAQVKEELEWFRAHRDDYSVLFLGTSRVRRHVIPSLFDRLTAERGMATRTYNFGIDSLAAPEDAFLLDQVLDAQPKQLRYVFIEISFFRAAFEDQAPDTIRTAYWHDWERTRLVCRQLLDNFAHIKPLRQRKKKLGGRWSEEVSKCLGQIVQHAQLFFTRAVNLGRGAEWLQVQAGVRQLNDRLAPLGPGRDGFIPSDRVISGAQADQYQQRLTALRTEPSRVRPMEPVQQENLETMLAKIRRHGAQPIIFFAPSSGGYVYHPLREVAPVLDFSDPQKWPELFDPQYRADVGHLNRAGAEVFTHRLCESFLALAATEHR